MKAKTLLVSLMMSFCLFIGYQKSIRQIVSAETKESVVLQETTSSTGTRITASSNATEESSDSTRPVDSSLIGENENTEMAETFNSSTRSNELKEIVEESRDSLRLVPETTTNSQTGLSVERIEENYQFSVSKNQTTETFIQIIGKDAQAIAWEEDLYASVMIAQAILETGSGNSQLAQPPYHNLFGIKGSFQGKQVSFKTQEDKGNGELYTIQAVFRQYPSHKESLEDYAALLRKGISGNADFYKETWKSTAGTYQEAAKTLTGKYATDTSYGKKLIALIDAYDLTTYDRNPATNTEAEQEQPVSDPIELENNSEDKQKVEASNEPVEPAIIVNETTQSAVMIPPTAQRPAKQLYGNRSVQ
ncbi:glucosaminidase domain-containing protein [Candidatus Enterococcus ferrettii]|uniref:Mannosyl-glycoprotein endo-beta-N-acetylglucosamidase-like domain-containing protein n=1 Tax=Candidatus Enterococcus ferrettii TaxID=2815324 RepID=A0ABV0EL93_9ENTE|nr:glucosaminidase domain-containing protein [Enterococcus sp. 665A]MBO1340175.1 glucosaminidase domain-containing protein [Enterococcus sp. 665A]